MKFELKKFINKNIAIHCETSEQIKQFAEILKTRQFKNKKCRWSDYTIPDGFCNTYSSGICFKFGEKAMCHLEAYTCIEQGYEIVKFKDLEFKELPKLYGYCFEDGVLEKQEVNILEETPHRYTVEHTKFNGYHARILKKDINKVFYDYRYYGLFLEPDEQSFKIQVLSKLKNDIDKLQKEIDRRENDIKILEVW